MRTQKCSSCGTILDISTLEKGSKFACSTCATVLTVGEAVAARKSLKESGPAYQPRAAKSQAEATPKRTRRSEEARETRGAPAKGAPVPLLLGIGGVVVAIIVVVVVMMGGDKGAGGAGGVGGGGSGGTPVAVKKKTPADWWAEATTNVDGSAKTLDAGVVRMILAEAKQKGYDQDPLFWKPREKELYATLLEKAPEDSEANRYAGRKNLLDYPDFDKLWKRAQDGFTEIPSDMQGLLREFEDRVEGRKPIWMTGEEYESVKGRFDALDATLKEMESNPYAAEIQKALARVKADPILMDYEAYPMVVHPFIVFLGSKELKHVQGYDKMTPAQKKEDDDRIARKRESMKEWSRDLERMYKAYVKEFEEKYRKPLGLPAFQPTDILFQWVFEDRQGFDQFNQRKEGGDVGAAVLGYFDPKTRWVYLYLRENSEDEGISDLNVMAHETTHQVQWFFSKDPANRLVNHFDELHAVWFTEGWAEYLGGSCRVHPDTKEPEFSWFAVGRVDTLRFMKKNGLPAVPLQDLVQRENYGEFMLWVNSWLGGQREAVPEESQKFLQPGFYLGALYAQGWLFVHYLNKYEGGKYREPFLDFVKMSLQGRIKPEKYRADASKPEKWKNVRDAFCDIFNVKSQADWDRMQREYDEVMAQVIRDAPLPKPTEDPHKQGG